MKLSAGCATNSRFGRLYPDVRRPPERIVRSLFILAAVSAVAPLLIACTGVSINPSFPEIAAAQSSPTATLSQATNVANTDISAINFDSLRIIAPGEGSQLISPIHLQAQIPAETAVVRVELYGSDNRLMLRKLLRTADSGQLNLELAFEVPASSERGRLVLSLENDYGRLQELDSIQVELLTEGESLLAPGNTQERLALNSPQAEAAIQGGQLPVSGLVRAPYGPLNIQLITREGRVLTSDDVYPESTQGETGTFTTVLAYSLQNPEWVQVRVSLRVGGVTWAVKSVEVRLEP